MDRQTELLYKYCVSMLTRELFSQEYKSHSLEILSTNADVL